MASPQAVNPDDTISAEAAKCAGDPYRWAMFAFNWGQGELKDSSGPRVWQADIMGAISSHLRNTGTRFQPLRLAVSSGNGIGKSALVGMLISWAMSTAVDTKVIVTANTGDQLATKTVPAVSEWFRRSINAHWWDVKATSIKAKDATYHSTWRTDFVTWSTDNVNAFQGLHNQGKRILVVFDEASGIADRIWEVTNGAVTDENTEIIWVAFGNPNDPIGMFRASFGNGQFAHRWNPKQIDSRNVEGTNKQEIKQWIEDWGEDHDFVRVRVKGEFPRTGSDQFISPDAVAAARKYRAEGFEQFPVVLGVDVARFGADRTVVFKRQGRKASLLGVYRGLDTAVVTAHVIEFAEQQNAKSIVVDSDGIGNTVFDQLKMHGYGHILHEFHGGKHAHNHAMYFNRRAEVWGLMRDALNAGMEIPDLPELEMDLTAPKYGFSPQNQISLEKKDEIKKRLPHQGSPDLGDALAYTFGVQLRAEPKEEPIPDFILGPPSHNWMS